MNDMEIKVSVKDIPEVIEQLQQAEDKINNLQSKIDKAIEYIEIHSRFEPPYYEMREFNNNANLNELYDILKDDK